MYNSETNEKKFDIRQRTFSFSIEIVNLVKELPKNTVGFAVGNQIIRSGTSVGANIEEAQNAGSKKDFIHGMTIALKEARETDYWLLIIKETKLIDTNLDYLLTEIKEIIKILTTIIKNTKQNIDKK